MNRRFLCTDCGMKWFVPADAPPADDPAACPACGGQLVPYAPELPTAAAAPAALGGRRDPC